MQYQRQFVVSLALAISLAGGFASAATIQTVAEKPLTGTLTGFKDGALVLKPKGAGAAVVKIPLADISVITLDSNDRWEPSVRPKYQPTTSPTATARKWQSTTLWHVELGAADHLTAFVDDWTEATATLALDTPDGVSLTVPLDQVRAVWSISADRVTAAKNLKLSAAAEDIAFVCQAIKDDPFGSKYDVVKPVTGLAVGFDDEFLTFKYEGQPRKIKLDRLAGLLLARRELPTEKSPYEVFTRTNGDVLSGRIEALTNNVFRIAPLVSLGGAGSHATLELPLATLAKIETRNGRLTWLGDLTPATVTQTPYLDRLMPYRVNESLTGGPLKLADGTVAHGIAVHSRCVLTYELGGTFDRFRAKAGFQQPEGKAGHAAVRVVGDGKVLWADADLKGDAQPTALDLSLSGIKSLTLEVDFGKFQDVAGRVIWGEARLIRGKVN